MSVVQPVPPPRTREQHDRYWRDGVLIDLAGRPLRKRACEQCDGEHAGGEPCHIEVVCPGCGSTARHCYRPSGHEAAWHAERVAELERLIGLLIAAGDLTIAAPWPSRPSANATQDALF